MKKRNIQESDINRIVRKVIKENNSETNEGLGDTWAGIKGMFRGYGYKYTKNLNKLSGILDDLSYSDSYLTKVKQKCEEIVDDIANAKMPEQRQDHILDIANKIISIINDYDKKMDRISSDVNKVLD